MRFVCMSKSLSDDHNVLSGDRFRSFPFLSSALWTQSTKETVQDTPSKEERSEVTALATVRR